MATEDKLRDYLKRVTVDLTDARRRLAEVEEGRHEPIAVIGMACRYPGGGDTVDGFWDLLHDGRSAVVEVPPERWDIDDYYDPDRRAVGAMYTRHGSFLNDIAGWDAEFFGLSPQEALRMDPQQRLLMELLWEGLENAGTARAEHRRQPHRRNGRLHGHRPVRHGWRPSGPRAWSPTRTSGRACRPAWSPAGWPTSSTCTARPSRWTPPARPRWSACTWRPRHCAAASATWRSRPARS